MNEVQWDGSERRAQPVTREEPRHWRIVEVFGPVVMLLAGGVAAFTGLQARLESQTEALKRLEPIPLQIANMRTDMNAAMTNIRLEQQQKLADLAERVVALEQRARQDRQDLREMRRGQ